VRSSVVVVLLLALVSAPTRGQPRTGQGTKPSRGEKPATELVRQVPFGVRCELVRSLFSEQAFDSLYRYLNVGCGKNAQMGGRAWVVGWVQSGPYDGATGLTPREVMFPEAERCEGTRFVVSSGVGERWGDYQQFIRLTVIPLAKGSYDFGVRVGTRAGTAVCAGVSGHAVLKGRKWTIAVGPMPGVPSQQRRDAPAAGAVPPQHPPQ
jgi:hypothetical protein